jgi:hypothetical protein
MAKTFKNIYKIIALLLATQIAVSSVMAQDNVDFNITIGDDEDDVIEIVFHDTGFDLFKYHGKSYLDIRSASSRLETGNVTFSMELYEQHREAENVYYEFFGWFNDSTDVLWNFIFSYSNHMANISYEHNGSAVNLTNNVVIQDNVITIILPLTYFQNATTFDFYAQAAERNPIGTRNNYFDTTEPVDVIAVEAINWYYVGVGMLILITITYAFFKIRKALYAPNKKGMKEGVRCLHCGSITEKDLGFCHRCGKDFERRKGK